MPLGSTPATQALATTILYAHTMVRAFIRSIVRSLVAQPWSLLATQEAMNEEQPPASSSSSETSLGKRKASDLSELCSPRFDAFRPHKAARSASAAAGPSTTEDDFFQDNSGPADEPVTINTPICIVSRTLVKFNIPRVNCCPTVTYTPPSKNIRCQEATLWCSI